MSERFDVDTGSDPGPEPRRPSHLERAHEEIERDMRLARRVELGAREHEVRRDEEKR